MSSRAGRNCSGVGQEPLVPEIAQAVNVDGYVLKSRGGGDANEGRPLSVAGVRSLTTLRGEGRGREGKGGEGKKSSCFQADVSVIRASKT